MDKNKTNLFEKGDYMFIGAVLGGFLGVAGVLLATYLNDYSPFVKHIIPQIQEVQQGFIAPNKLEVKCEDLNGDGLPETIIQIGKDNYFLKEEDGKPVLVGYKIEPEKTIPQRIVEE